MLASLKTDIALHALEQALHARRPGGGLVHHSGRGVEYLYALARNRQPLKKPNPAAPPSEPASMA